MSDSNIIDRRQNDKGKSVVNKRKFLKRVEGQIKKAIPNIVSEQDIKDITSGKGKVSVPIKGVKEPRFRHNSEGGTKRQVHPGNKKYIEGDEVKKPLSQRGGRGSKGSNDPSVDKDEFTIVLSREEFLHYFFKDLELPDMVKKYLESVVDFKNKRAGFTQYGTPSKLNVVHSYKESLARRIATEAYYREMIEKLNEELNDSSIDDDRKKEIEEEIKEWQDKLDNIPYFDEFDLRYNNYEKVPVPTMSAVMFCIMDVSGSMGYEEKDIAKRFFLLLYMFLTKQYENIELVFIRHHTQAKEVTEKEFFESSETGGTMVAPSLELMSKIMKERYSNGNWNIYCCQASDGDTWSEIDAIDSARILRNDILPKIQYMAYIEVMRDGQNDLWDSYSILKNECKNFAMKQIHDLSEIWPVFKGLFEKEKLTA